MNARTRESERRLGSPGALQNICPWGVSRRTYAGLVDDPEKLLEDVL